MQSSTYASRSISAAVVFAFILIFTLLFHIDRAFAQNGGGPEIFDVRRSLPMEPDEPVTKDFYINAGPESGLKKGVYISVVRSVPIHDPIKNIQQATLNIPVGKLQVIDVQRGITVARLQSELGDDERPTLEFEGIMIGDHIDLGSITTDAPKKPKKEKRHVASTDDESSSAGQASAPTASTEKRAQATSPAVAVPTVDGLSAIGTAAGAAAAKAASSSTANATATTPNTTAQPAATGPAATAPSSPSAATAPAAPQQTEPRSADATDSTSAANLDT